MVLVKHREYAVLPDGSILWLEEPDDYRLLAEEIADNAPEWDDWE